MISFENTWMSSFCISWKTAANHYKQYDSNPDLILLKKKLYKIFSNEINAYFMCYVLCYFWWILRRKAIFYVKFILIFVIQTDAF